MVDLQELVDDLADAIGRPVSIEDRRWRLVAFSAYTEHDDRVREESILARAAPPDVAAWLDTLGLERAGGVVDTPPNPAISMGPRTCAPVRHGDTLLGFLWVIPGEEPLDAAQRAAVADAARAAGAALWHRRAAAREAHERGAALLAALLDDPSPAVVSELAELHGWDPDARFAVGVGAVADEDAAEETGERVRRRRHAGDLVWRGDGGRVTVLAHRDAPGDIARELRRAGAAHAAAAACPGLGAARDALRRAADALLVVRRLPKLGPAAAAEELGAWPDVARLWSASGRPAAPEPLGPLLADRQGRTLATALEQVLDAGGDVAAAAAKLHVHRATLYRRIGRAEELCGVDLASGDDRLRLHLALRMWRLAGGGS